VAPGWVRSLIHNPPQGLTALAPPERGIVRLFIRRGMKHFHALWCSTGAWMAPMKIVLVLGFSLIFPNKTEDENDDEDEYDVFTLGGAARRHGRLL